MAARLRAKHQDEIRTKIQTSQLINRLQECGLGELELRHDQLRSIEILLKKSLPDLSQIELSGDEDNPVNLKHVVEFVNASATPEKS